MGKMAERILADDFQIQLTVLIKNHHKNFSFDDHNLRTIQKFRSFTTVTGHGPRVHSAPPLVAL